MACLQAVEFKELDIDCLETVTAQTTDAPISGVISLGLGPVSIKGDAAVGVLFVKYPFSYTLELPAQSGMRLGFTASTRINWDTRKCSIRGFKIVKANLYQNFSPKVTGVSIPLLSSIPLAGDALEGARREPFSFTPMGVNSIPFGSPRVRCTPMGVHRTCGEPDEIKRNTHPKKHYRSFW